MIRLHLSWFFTGIFLFAFCGAIFFFIEGLNSNTQIVIWKLILAALVTLLILLLLTSLINYLFVYKFFFYPKGEFVEGLYKEFKKYRLSKKIYFVLRGIIIFIILLINVGAISQSFDYYSSASMVIGGIIGATWYPILALIFLKGIFSIFDRIVTKKDNAEIE